LKIVELPDEPRTVIAIDRGEHDLAAATALLKNNPEKPSQLKDSSGETLKLKGLEVFQSHQEKTTKKTSEKG